MLARPEIPKVPQINPNRPKVALRRISDPKLRLALKEYARNRGTQAEALSLSNWEALYAGQPVAVT